MQIILPTIIIIIAYLIGSISSSVIICKIAKKPDPRTQGSGNAGATNVLRFAGKKIAIFTLISDMLKGTIAVLIGRLLGLEGLILGLVAIAVILGHIYPIFFKFKGGKGIATGLGVMFALSPALGIMAVLTWIVIASIFRYSSLAALVTFSLAPIYTIFLASHTYFIPLAMITALVIWRHRKNILRLKIGTENKIGEKTDVT